MKQATLSAIKTRISEVARKSTFSDRVKKIDLDLAGDDKGADFLRVIVEVRSIGRVSNRELAALSDSIEDAVSKIDDRFASVRFADAA